MEKFPTYGEPLDSPNIDTDPDFREALRLLNAAGVRTVSSCQGHAPGARYSDITSWMRAYITCETDSVSFEKTCGLLSACGGTVTGPKDGKVRVSFPEGWDWKRSVGGLRARLPHIR